MKKIVYAILSCIIVVGAIITCTMGLKADIIYSKNVQLDIYIGKAFETKDIKEIVNEIFPGEKSIIKKVELFNDMVAVTLPEKSDEELKEKIEELNTKLNEKYEIENKAEDITISHNPKVKLSSILKPYIIPVAISIIIILIYVMVRYRELGIWKTFAHYMLSVGAVEAVYLSILAITRFQINRLVIPIGLVLYITTITVLGFINENQLEAKTEKENENAKNKKKK